MPVAATQRVLQGVAATVEVTLFDQDGVATAAAGDVTAEVTRADGTTLVAAGAATTSGGTGVYRLALDADDTANLDLLTVTWTDDGDDSTHTTTVEIVGGYYVSVADIRAAKNLSDTSKFTNPELIAARRWFEDKFERATGVAWVPRYTRLVVDGTGGYTLPVDVMQIRAVRSVRAYTSVDDYTAYTADELADLGIDTWGQLRRLYLGTFTAGAKNYVLEIEHGYDAPPADVKEAAIVAIRDKLLGDQTGSRVYAVQTEDGIIRNATAGTNTPFGLPFVDEVVAARNHTVPAVA